MDSQAIDQILQKYDYGHSSIIAILQDLQEKENYLPEKDLDYVSERLSMPLTRIYRIATFYNAFSLTPRGKYLVNVCLGTACHVRGAARVLDRIKMYLGIDVGEMTKDKLFSLETVNCLGSCALGPIVVIGNEYHGQMTPAKVESTIKKYRKRSSRKKDEKD
ncbi:MAG: NAD(P)H-dependent oxidoreductase subunit E [Deltaproteobacteria bacterium]|nr:MAG: NAD(P)H-dependent oxidoreductase subunit E [Deltaproteobacteria bacterium]